MTADVTDYADGNLEPLAARRGRSIGSEMLPNYDDFLIKRFEQPDGGAHIRKRKIRGIKRGRV
jgi:hypothetical protein